nr:hypothetical protein [Photorhabdus luminescens]
MKVGEHTQLDDAVIASTADKDKNTLDTGTLGFGDIQNKMNFKTKHHNFPLPGLTGIIGCPQELDSHN